MSQPTTTHTPEDWRRVVGPEDAAHFREQGWWRDTTGLDELLRAVQRHPHKAAVVCYRKGDPLPTVITYGQLGTMVDRFAGAFLKLGVEPGDVVTIQLPNTWEFPALVFGAMRAGAIPNPVPHIYRERELSFMLRHARSKVYVVQSRFKGTPTATSGCVSSRRCPTCGTWSRSADRPVATPSTSPTSSSALCTSTTTGSRRSSTRAAPGRTTPPS
ncbi:hypothetical protein Psuf_001200 [Phytohabitans suffuscus]|uniref:AMP-dependent synthetase/ligase domain-containing protein n=1 Tax=Phytohabitans suffuscus TaxID=624315 RepID=A0A6F8Y9R2_9ACTN|nr:AMP-binding protein [Phytohabitans suffuscus]BCB82807.1 hypothetical protein Psuf_001200 [Phytohabitans suffuscus]